ncbi:hypothetical protein LX99_01402 [Mucilaginibacter oryzae]|uniref:Uncharacterized protein n=1 Tax=Mucilaginibacter oryzae TaxID=468058 RepID=A0A316HED7_9SPHI|nr:hypothetical protein LX99_01402 [Mucilaginibacter oryzae]
MPYFTKLLLINPLLTIEYPFPLMTAEFRVSPSPEQKINSVVCRKCKGELRRIPRSGFVKFFLFGMPFKKYMCFKCARKTYRWVPTK